MVYMMLRDGTKIEATGEQAAIEGEAVVCRDADGRAVDRVPRSLVLAYGKHVALMPGRLYPKPVRIDVA